MKKALRASQTKAAPSMQLQVFLPQRRVGDSVRVGRLYRGRYRLEGDAKPTEVALGVTDESEARQKLEAIVRDEQLERKGLLPPKPQREATNKELPDIIEDFIRSREGLGRDHKYLCGIEQQLLRLARESGWKRTHEITLDSFEKWRASHKLSPKTLNEYLTTANTFLNWMVKTLRIPANPLQHADRVGTGNYEKRTRRAVTYEQLQKLFAVSEQHGTLYKVAAFTGLRRGELQKLQWKDVQLDGDKPCIHARATTTKNGKQASLPLHPEVAEALRNRRDTHPHTRGAEPVFLKMPDIDRYKRDLKLAGIPYTDERGHVFDFHALRKTFGTLLAANGVHPREAMELMRHSDLKLTTKIYTDAGHLPLRESVLKIAGADVVLTQQDDSDTRADTQNTPKHTQKRVLSVFDGKPTLTEKDLMGMDPENYIAFDSEGNIADYALEWLGTANRNATDLMAHPAGIEPATYGLEIRCSSPLSYGRRAKRARS